jgi:3-dehydroquinate synthase II
MKEIWVKVEPWNKKLVTTALEGGADAVIVSADKVDEVRQLGIIKTVSEKGDIKWGEDVVIMEIRSAEDEDKIVETSLTKKVIVRTKDWKIIPLENLVARAKNIFVEVKDVDEATTAFGILEKGVDGIVIVERDPIKVKEIISKIKSEKDVIPLVEFEVQSVTPLGMGDRVCVDTCTNMNPGEGMLVGNSSQALFLVHSESIENPYVEPRPFRVNAGPVHAYIMVPGGKTKYLSELKSGDTVTCVNWKGELFPVIVGRVKVEKRPLLLVEAQGPMGPVSIILQNAETIRLVGREGEALSVVKLKKGDKVLGYVEEAGRHFGHKIKETIIEK